MFQGTGVIIYDPPRRMKRNTEWWCVVNVDVEIARYYRYLVKKALNIDTYLAHPAHISVIRGERPSDSKMHLWRKYHGERIHFRYDYYVRQSGDTTGNDRPDCYWFVNIECQKLIAIREEFGFPASFQSHLTVGRT
jgi:hypothetical protein